MLKAPLLITFIGIFGLWSATSHAVWLSPAYSGGTCKITNGSPGGDYTFSGETYGGGGTGSGAKCSGTITTTFTWQGSDPPPAAAVVIQQCSASCWEYGLGLCSADNGLGDPASGSTMVSPPFASQQSGTNGSTRISHYSVVAVQGGTVTVTCEPVVEALGSTSNAGVIYSASIQSLDIHFTDTNGTGADDARKYWIGQNVKAQLSSPLTVASRKWVASGCTPFASYTRSTASAVLTLLPDENTAEKFSGYFAKGGDATLACSGKLTVPSGAKPADGLPFSVSRTFTLNAPNLADLKGVPGTQGGYPDPANATGLWCFGLSYTDPDLSPPLDPHITCGVYFTAHLPSATSVGRFNFVQTMNLSRHRSGAGVSQSEGVLLDGSYYTSGLDNGFPYAPTQSQAGEGYPYFDASHMHYASDGPGESLLDAPTWTSYSIEGESFEMYVMYNPPGTASMDVPVYMWTWSWSASASYTNGLWVAPDTPMTDPVPHKVDDISHPVWKRVVSNFVWHS